MSGKRLSALLVTAEIAVTIVLLAGAGLMARSFLKIYTEDIGINTPNILVASVGLPPMRVIPMLSPGWPSLTGLLRS